MLRKFIAGLAVGMALLFSALVMSGPVFADSGPLCARFGAGSAGLDNWGACAAAPNIVVTTSNVSSIGGAGDYYLHLLDTPGASAACSTDAKYLGNWVEKMGGCGQFCFDFKVFVSGTPPGPITPSFTIWSGASSATFVANFTVTAADPWRQNICAPINLIQAGDSLPSSSSGSWKISGSSAYNANWNSIISGVTMIQLPIDWTSNPDEEAGYDNLCMSPGGCGHPPKPVVTGCLKDSKIEIKCNADGTYTLTLSGAGFTGTEITLASQTSGVTITPPRQPWAATTTWTISGATSGQTVSLAASETKLGGGSKPGTDLCCSGEIRIVMPDCPKPVPVDLKIAKEEIKTPEGTPANHHWFDLTVTNAGAVFSYPANSIAVTEVVPAGMTISSIGGTGWNCLPPTAVGPALIICTYAPAGSIAANGTLPAIIVHAATTGHPPWLNCGLVNLAASSGLVDTDPKNNKSCIKVGDNGVFVVEKKVQNHTEGDLSTWTYPVKVDCGGVANTYNLTDGGQHSVNNLAYGTVCSVSENTGSLPVPARACPDKRSVPVWSTTYVPASTTINGSNATATIVNILECKPIKQVCTPPMVPNATGGCVCPPGTHLVDGTCEGPPPPVCPPPMIPGAVAGQCVCPVGTTLSGRECVKTHKTCLPPMVQNAAGTCSCPRGTSLSGGKCVRPVIVCKPPARLGSQGACECPADMTLQGRSCVPKKRQLPDISPGDVIKIIPRIFPGGNDNQPTDTGNGRSSPIK